MLANARVFGHVFNPLSVFWCLNDDGSQRCVVAEVHNTYGERHCYLLETDERGAVRTSKEFYVSPFNDLDGEYRMRLPLPDTALALSIVLARDGKAPFVATVSGRCVPATTREIVRSALAIPLAPLRVAAQIRFQGIRLWARRLPIVPPTATSPAGGSAMTTTTLAPNLPLTRSKPSGGRASPPCRAGSKCGLHHRLPAPVPQGGRTFAAACPDAQR